MTPLAINERAGSMLQRDISIPGMGARVNPRDLAVFSRQFATMTGSGMSLLRSLAVLEDQTGNRR